ncbi:MAG TPA: PQQ-dependent sugar dehydrogenase [candidate division Zixibacteria bacterium]|nr:PQQ-dependent sugar dehydrogenase [candidate division Zixibacteria bacterium]
MKFSLKHIRTLVAFAVSALGVTVRVGAVDLTTEPFATGLDNPVFLTAPPGDSTRIYIVEQTGRIQLYKNGVYAGVFLDLTAKVVVDFEQGLLGLAFHPQFPDSPYFYVNYTAPGGGPAGHTVVSRFTIDGSPDLADTAESIILTQDQPQANHNAGMLAFGPGDGYLYIALGDGGGFGDQHGAVGNGQDQTTLLGKILRIDVDGAAPYAIPPDNPFIAPVDTLPEIWALGLRNPWRFSFDRETADLWIADVGQQTWEEIDFEAAGSSGGVNWGWRLREGAHCYNPASGCDPGGITTDPLFEYSHDSGRCSISGGYVYRGCVMPELQGTYFYGDYCSGEVFSLRNVGGVPIDAQTHFTLSQVTSFGEDAAGEIYVCQLTGDVVKIVPAAPMAPCGSCCAVAGDANHDGAANIADATTLIAWIFSGGAAPYCLDEADADGSNANNIGDVTTLIAWIFSGGAAPVCGSTGF